jgi:Tfp pilus assembly protein PilN
MSTARSANRFAALVMAAMISFSLYGMLAYAFRAERLGTLNAEIKDTHAPVVKVQRMIEVIREANRRQDVRFAPVNVLPVIHSAVPKDMYIESMDIDSKKRIVSLAGTASTFQDIQKLIKSLEMHKLFTNVAEEGNTTRDNKGRYKFKVVAHFEED